MMEVLVKHFTIDTPVVNWHQFVSYVGDKVSRARFTGLHTGKLSSWCILEVQVSFKRQIWSEYLVEVSWDD